MAKDVAQRELDQSGFRISHLGDPAAAGDATKTDNATIPRPDSGAGAPGASLLAAPADHVHPASGGAGDNKVSLDDPSEQSVSGTAAEVVSEFVVNFEELVGQHMEVSITGLVKVSAGNARFGIQVGGTPGVADGTDLISFSTNSTAFEMDGGSGDGFDKPRHGLTLVKFVGSTEQPAAVAHIRCKSVEFRGQP